MALSEQTRQQIAALIHNHDVILFMKGTRDMPQCGFSAKVVEILDGLLPEYETVDVLTDPAVREGIKEYSAWPTIPQLYVKGELIGGCDIVTDLYGAGELHGKLGLATPDRTVPTIHISAAAARRIRDYTDREPDKLLRLSVNARFHTALGLAPRQDRDIAVQANGITVLMDPFTALRADGLSIDLVETPDGTRLTVENPNAPVQTA